MAEEKKRLSNIELLRIISMLMIVGLHYLDKGGLLPEVTTKFGLNGYVAWAFEAFFLSSVNVFFLISGYFALDRSFSARKVLNFWLQVVTYSLGFGIIASVIIGKSIDIYTFFQYCFPLVTNHYWFASVYIILFLITPLLANGFKNLDQKTTLSIIGFLVLLGSIAKTIIPMKLAIDEKGYNVTWMLAVYLTGMYIKKYGIPKLTKSVYVIIYAVSSIIIFLSMVVLQQLYFKKGMLEDFIKYGFSYNFLFCFIASIALFMAFEKSDEVRGKAAAFINKIAGATFGVYLFHEHLDIRYLWPQALNSGEYINKSLMLFIAHMILSIVIIFSIGIVIELFRQKAMHFKENIGLMLLVLIGLFSIRKCFMGIDLMDAGYSLGNYRFFETMDKNWKLATYFANVIGWLLMKLPGGEYWAGMNFYTSLILGITAICVFIWLNKKYNNKKHMLFIGAILGLCLCWSPSVILYQYLGFVIMTFTVILLVEAILMNETKYFVIAGALLGASLFVRMPNVAYVLLIFPVIYGVYDSELAIKERWQKIGARFLQCIIGYIVAVVPCYLWIVIRYGFNAYPDMIASLFSMTEEATDYKPVMMIYSQFENYIKYFPWVLAFAVYTCIGIIFFKFYKLKGLNIFKGIYILGCFALIRILWGKGYFGLAYNNFFAVLKPMVTYITIVILNCVYIMLSKKYAKMEKVLAAFILGIIFISPLGGNNHVYSVMQNMFLIFPISLILLDKIIGETKSFAVNAVAGVFFLLLSIQVLLFGMNFTFHDLDKTENTKVISQIKGTEVTTGLTTSYERNEALSGLGEYLENSSLLDSKVILYGDIPSVSYIFDMEPAIFTTWPSLASKEIGYLKTDLENLKISPVIITSKQPGKDLLMPQNIEDNKLMLIYEYISEQGYHCSYFNDEFYVFIK